MMPQINLNPQSSQVPEFTSAPPAYQTIFWRHMHDTLLFILCHQILIHYIASRLFLPLYLSQDSKIGIYQKMWRFMEVSSFPFRFPFTHPTAR